jgi:hypothetical protein
MAYNVPADPRVATVGIWNSGLLQPDEKIFASHLHSPVIIVTGGESDIAYANGKRDFERCRRACRFSTATSIRTVGPRRHITRTMAGAFGVVMVKLLKWQLMSDVSAKGKGYFVGSVLRPLREFSVETDSRSPR